MGVGVGVAARMGGGQRQTLIENETGSDNQNRTGIQTLTQLLMLLSFLLTLPHFHLSS
ncbi:hypothetical protein HYU92_06525 [Candidatus Curtissbacteria bacterium]|nr:hypothetical protein [Candidatus Curtissbacteria bacterium]